MTPIRLAAAATLALLVATGCGPEREATLTSGAEQTERAPAPTDRPGPRPRAPGTGGGPGPASEEPGAPEPKPSGASSTQQPAGRETGRESAPEETVAAYVAALARAGEPERMREGLARAAEDSTAHDYLTHQTAVAQARADGGGGAPDAEVGHIEDGYELCPAGDPPCVSYTGFTSRGALLTGLLVDGRDPGPNLLAADGVEDESEGVRATLLTYYQSATDKSLVVTVEFTTADNASLDIPQASYERGDGSERAREAVGRYELDAGSATHAAFSFPGATPGGTLRVGGCLEECSSLVDIELPVE